MVEHVKDTWKSIFNPLIVYRKFRLKNDPVKRLTISQGTSMHRKIPSTILKCDFCYEVFGYEFAPWNFLFQIVNSIPNSVAFSLILYSFVRSNKRGKSLKKAIEESVEVLNEDIIRKRSRKEKRKRIEWETKMKDYIE